MTLHKTGNGPRNTWKLPLNSKSEARFHPVEWQPHGSGRASKRL